MRGPLSVKLSDGSDTVDITRKTDGLRFKRSAFGGDVDLTCTARVSRTLLGNLGPEGSVVVYGPDGEEWSGTPDNPGGTNGAAGQSFDLQAFGGAARLQAAKTALGYVIDDATFGRSSNSTKGAKTDGGERPDGTPSLEVSWDKGYGVESGDIGEFVFRAFQKAGLKVGRFRADIDAGLGSAGYKQRLMTGTDVASLNPGDVADASTSAGVLRAYINGGGITLGDDIIAVRAIRSGADETAAKATWFRFWNMTARQVLKTVTGANITDTAVYTGTDADVVYAHQVIADMIGRGMAPGADPAKVTIAPTTYGINPLSFLDGITMGDAMTALQVFERDLFWTLYGDTFTSGLWDDAADPSYVISRREGGITLPGQEMTLCNRVAVTWTDRRKKEHTTVVTADVPGLTYTRDAEPITLPAGTGSDANAQRAGLKALAITNNPPRAGTAVVRRKIRDLAGGCDVWPHEIRPGCIVMEQETGDTFRLTETEYNDADGTATLTLGEPVRTIDQFMSHLARKQRRRA